jgi:hypothetical protein
MRTSGTSVAIVILLVGGIGGPMTYSFQNSPRSIFRIAPVPLALAPSVKPVPVQPINDGTDVPSRARSWFDAATGKICLGTEIKKTCR